MTKVPPSWPQAFSMSGVVIAAFGLATPALAQQVDDTQTFAEAAASDRIDRDHVTIGIGAAALADFQGSRHYQIQPAPIIDIEQGRFFAKSGEGIGIKVINTTNFQAGLSVNWMRGYDAKDVPEGIGELKSTFGGRAFVSGQFAGFAATVAVTAPVFGGDAEGVLTSARIAYPVRLSSSITISPAVGVSWADGKYMRRYFGVNEEQAAASDLPVYQPSSGFKDVDARLAVSFRLTRKISLVVIGMITRNLDRVTGSPFVERRWSPAGVLGVAYTF
jgi:outer membrane protein